MISEILKILQSTRKILLLFGGVGTFFLLTLLFWDIAGGGDSVALKSGFLKVLIFFTGVGFLAVLYIVIVRSAPNKLLQLHAEQCLQKATETMSRVEWANERIQRSHQAMQKSVAQHSITLKTQIDMSELAILRAKELSDAQLEKYKADFELLLAAHKEELRAIVEDLGEVALKQQRQVRGIAARKST